MSIDPVVSSPGPFWPGDILPSCCLLLLTIIQTFSPLILLDQLEPNLVLVFLRVFCRELIFDPSKKTWSPLLKIEHRALLHLFAIFNVFYFSKTAGQNSLKTDMSVLLVWAIRIFTLEIIWPFLQKQIVATQARLAMRAL